jgi:hypothetical protein
MQHASGSRRPLAFGASHRTTPRGCLARPCARAIFPCLSFPSCPTIFRIERDSTGPFSQQSRLDRHQSTTEWCGVITISAGIQGEIMVTFPCSPTAVATVKSVGGGILTGSTGVFRAQRRPSIVSKRCSSGESWRSSRVSSLFLRMTSWRRRANSSARRRAISPGSPDIWSITKTATRKGWAARRLRPSSPTSPSIGKSLLPRRIKPSTPCSFFTAMCSK